jgi:hypothetical protein
MKEFENLICNHVETVAFNDQRATFENDDVKIIMILKNPSMHGKFSVGDNLSECGYDSESTPPTE